MPTYEYACTECGHRIEEVRSIADAPLTTCTVCGGQLRKVFSPVGIVFKGSGFYKTDSRGKAPSKVGTDGADKAGKGSKPDGKAGKKPADSTSSSTSSTSKASEKSA
jgi:putative FmdB family regulatory protein